jgi:hypothetical protein
MPWKCIIVCCTHDLRFSNITRRGLVCCGGGLLCDSQYLDENKQLILAILDNQSLGKIQDCAT